MFECDACHVNDGLILQLLVHRPRAYIWIYIYIRLLLLWTSGESSLYQHCIKELGIFGSRFKHLNPLP